MEFTPFPKMGRLTRECIITEKIDGTNAQVLILQMDSGALADQYPDPVFRNVIAHRRVWDDPQTTEVMFAGSRTRFVTPGKDDNYGFAGWVKEHADNLFALGSGRHFGEWWGGEIQRGYGLTEKRFSLFNTSRWTLETTPTCCSVVPVLFQGMFGDRVVDNMIEKLRHEGSVAAPGFMQPEGVVVFHTATGVMFKKALEKDEQPKGQKS